ncbi:hypothetical protein ABID21_003291 [Pseudorhizobium tarimense]|uniref:Uncharacterized protein n=1 Tax=Pseudorhizobium tarimense TaxID=1079109 RepID=A0ABV2H9N4_9HYPH|nr:hypothetical protein [Pseudorhizobium tarimense]MCJ8520200.1 hypothetical protein [Pseudorhizobium tarimense]
MRYLAIAAALAPMLFVSTLPAHAESRSWTGGSHGYGYHHYHKSRSPVGYTTPVARVREVGTFSRSVWAISRYEQAERSALAPLATIIHVDPSSFGSSACSYEAGVCVVRAER